MKPETTDDLIVHFECGHKALNPATSTKIYKYICPECGKQRRATGFEYLCADCGGLISVKYRKGNYPKYCAGCKKARSASYQRRYQSRTPAFEVDRSATECSLNDIARELGVTRQRAAQIFNVAIKKFRTRWFQMYGTEPPIGEMPEQSAWGEKHGWSYGGIE